MSTPIETNTKELQNILQTVYNLPNAGGGGTIPDNARLYYVGNAVGTLNLSIFNPTTNVVGVLT